MIQADNIIIQTIHDELLHAHDVSLRVVRFDLAHPVVGGNKWYKLQSNLTLAREQGATQLLSFGGAYSNHIYALSAAAAQAGLDSIGIIRGELVEPLNPTLAFAAGQGMQLIAVSRSDYRRRHDPAYINWLQAQYGPFYLIPEGGANLAGVRGCEMMAAWLVAQIPNLQACEIALACGTGTTLAGMLSGLRRLCQAPDARPFIRGFAVLKGADFLRQDIAHWLERLGTDCDAEDWELETGYHGGGYARADAALLAFIEHFSRQYGIPLEPVYTGKLLYGLYQRISAGQYPPGTRLIALHTGGLRQITDSPR